MKSKSIALFLLFFTTIRWQCQSLIISEIYPNPPGTDNNKEWLELNNNTDQTLLLEQYILQINDKTIPLPTSIPPHSLKIISPQITIPNSNTEISLKKSQTIIEQINYPKAPEDKSLSQINGHYYWINPSKNQPNPSANKFQGIFQELLKTNKIQIKNKNQLLLKLIINKKVKLLTIGKTVHQIKLINSP